MPVRSLPLFLVSAAILTTLTAEIADCRSANAADEAANLAGGALAGQRYRVIVSTDIGGTDPDDFQSLVHLLVYSDVLDLEGLISSPYGRGRKQDILDVIDCYEQDFAHLQTYSNRYPSPDELRALTKQGETERAPHSGVRQGTEGSQWIVSCARRSDPRPLHVLVWGGLEDLAQALYDAPDILPKLRVYWIGGPNKKWSPDAYQYIASHHLDLWIIEANATYRGWFTGGNQKGEWGNREFVRQHIAGHGALGGFFVRQKEDIKMGDSPSVGWLLRGTPTDPSQPGWGGRFVRAWDRPPAVFRRMTTADDQIEEFGILELALAIPEQRPDTPEAELLVENQTLQGHLASDGTMRFRFCPKGSKTYRFAIRSNVSGLHGRKGGITAVPISPTAARRRSIRRRQWWTDDPSPGLAEGNHIGAKTVSRWRDDFLRDFAERMDRCVTPHTSPD